MNLLKNTITVTGFIVLSMMQSTGFALTDGYPKNTKIDVINYIFNLELSDLTDEILCKTQQIFTLIYETSKLVKDLPDFKSWEHKQDDGYIRLGESITEPGLQESASRLWKRARCIYADKYDVCYWMETHWDRDVERYYNLENGKRIYLPKI